MSYVIFTRLFGSASIDGEMSTFLIDFVDLNFLSLRGLNIADWFFFNLLLKGPAKRALLGIKHLNKLHSSEKDCSFLRPVGIINLRKASFVRDAIPSCLGQLPLPWSQLH